MKMSTSLGMDAHTTYHIDTLGFIVTILARKNGDGSSADCKRHLQQQCSTSRYDLRLS